MSVLIKGMEVPNSCYECVINHKFFKNLHCSELDGMSGFETLDFPHEYERHPDCPLIPVPSHGRLIDADALIEQINEALPDAQAEAKTEWHKELVREVSVGFVWDLQDAPTIIEAERTNK